MAEAYVADKQDGVIRRLVDGAMNLDQRYLYVLKDISEQGPPKSIKP